MAIKKTTSDIAVFTRNHEIYLKDAARRPRGARTTFRSKVKWVSAERALMKHGPRRIYFVSIDGSRIVDYQAQLVAIQTLPSIRNPTTRRLLKHELASTRKGRERLWDDLVKTLYVITNCRPLRKRESFPQTSLTKVSNGQRLQREYKRSYSIVHEL